MNSAEAERLGREAVEMGWKWRIGMRARRYGVLYPWLVTDNAGRIPEDFPDFRDELTALACIPWVRSVYEEYCSALGSISFHWDESIGKHWIEVNEDTAGVGPTLAHAAIAAVKAARQ